MNECDIRRRSSSPPVYMDMYRHCTLCPRACGVNRLNGAKGVCGTDAGMRIARAALHFWEEPCISGKNGAGAVFFCGCPLHCVYCQNKKISDGYNGTVISVQRLAEIFSELEQKGAHNIDLVSGTHFVPQLAQALKAAKKNGLSIPVIYNCGGYESIQTLLMLEGLVDVYLPDIKTLDSKLAADLYHAADYPRLAMSALEEMFRQAGGAVFDDNGCIKSGVIVRHLVIPGHTDDALDVTDAVYDKYGDSVWLSIMSQYTPMPHIRYPDYLCRGVSAEEYERVTDYIWGKGITNCFVQDGDSAGESFIPDFNGEGV